MYFTGRLQFNGNVYAAYHDAHQIQQASLADREKSVAFLYPQVKSSRGKSWRNAVFPDHLPRLHRIGLGRPINPLSCTVRSGLPPPFWKPETNKFSESRNFSEIDYDMYLTGRLFCSPS